MPDRIHVIVGGGLAAGAAAKTLREEGHDGRIVVICEEPEAPYERPPLSKDFLRGETDELSLAAPRAFYAEHDVDLRTGTAVSYLDPISQVVQLGRRDFLHFDRLLLATGAAPRTLDVPGAELDGVLTLRTAEDARRLRDAIRAARRVAVVGAGWIGAEVAASARQMGADVTLIERGPAPLQHVLGPTIAGLFADLHRDHGVQLLCDADVVSFDGSDRVERVTLGDGTNVECDVVVVGVGVVPRSELARTGGLATDDGILVDAALQTSADCIYAAGDVASVLHPFYDRHVRVEHWDVALHQGELAARAMLGRPVRWDRLPYFFSDQYDLSMEYLGLADPGDELVVRGDLEARELIAFWCREGRVTAALQINADASGDALETLIRTRTPVGASALADPGIPLGTLAAHAVPAA